MKQELREELKIQSKQLQKGLALSHWKIKLTFRDTKHKRGSVRWARNLSKGKIATINICPNKNKTEKDFVRVLLHEFYHLLMFEITLNIAEERAITYQIFETDWDNLERLVGLSEVVRKRKGFTIKDFNRRGEKANRK